MRISMPAVPCMVGLPRSHVRCYPTLRHTMMRDTLLVDSPVPTSVSEIARLRARLRVCVFSKNQLPAFTSLVEFKLEHGRECTAAERISNLFLFNEK
jgi:hypothetical protein